MTRCGDASQSRTLPRVPGADTVLSAALAAWRIPRHRGDLNDRTAFGSRLVGSKPSPPKLP